MGIVGMANICSQHIHKPTHTNTYEGQAKRCNNEMKYVKSAATNGFTWVWF